MFQLIFEAVVGEDGHSVDDQPNFVIEFIFLILQALLRIPLSIGEVFSLLLFLGLVLLIEILKQIVIHTGVAPVFTRIAGRVSGHKHAQTVVVSEQVGVVGHQDQVFVPA